MVKKIGILVLVLICFSSIVYAVPSVLLNETFETINIIPSSIPRIQLTSPNFTGNLTQALSGDFVLKAGDTMTGDLAMSGNNITDIGNITTEESHSNKKLCVGVNCFFINVFSELFRTFWTEAGLFSNHTIGVFDVNTNALCNHMNRSGIYFNDCVNSYSSVRMYKSKANMVSIEGNLNLTDDLYMNNNSIIFSNLRANKIILDGVGGGLQIRQNNFDEMLLESDTNFVLNAPSGSVKLTPSSQVRIGTGQAGVDYQLFFNGQGANDGDFKWMEDENYFQFNDNVTLDKFLIVRENATFEEDVIIEGILYGGSPVKIDGINITNNLFMLEENRNSSSRFTLTNKNESSNASAVISAVNDVGGSVSIGIGSSMFKLGNNLYSNLTAFFSRSKGETVFANFYNEPFIWLTNPSDDNDVNNLVEVMRVDSGGLNVTGNTSLDNLEFNQIITNEDKKPLNFYSGTTGGDSITHLNFSTDRFRINGKDNKIKVTFFEKLSSANKIFRITHIEGTEKELFVVAPAGIHNASYFRRSLIVGGDGTDCRTTDGGFELIDCDSDSTGSDFGVQDDMQIKGNVYAGNGTVNLTETGGIDLINNITMTSPDNTVWTCGVDNTGVFSCT